MKYLIAFLSLTLLLSQELEVEGDLKVTGTVINDSLQQVIEGLQTQITLLQGSENSQISAKIFEVPIQMTSSYQELLFSINELLNENQNWYRLTFISFDYDDMGESFTCSHEIGVNTTNLFPEVINAIGIPRYPIEIYRGNSGIVEIYTVNNGSHPVFIISDSDPKFGLNLEPVTLVQVDIGLVL